MPSNRRPGLLVAFYADADLYPPTFNAISVLREHFSVHVVMARSSHGGRRWPEDVEIARVAESQSTADGASRSSVQKAAAFARFVSAVRVALKSRAPRVVLAYDPHALVATFLAGCRVPIVFHRHELEEIGATRPRTLGDLVYRAALPLSRRAAVTVFPDQGRAAYYSAKVPGLPEPLVVPNFPLRSTFPAPDWASLLGARFARRQAVLRGALGHHNGVIKAVEALQFTRETRLLLCGAGGPGFASELMRRADELRVSPRIELAGEVPFDRHSETLNASVGLAPYQAVDVRLRLSVTASNKIYEYAACGLPALAPSWPSYREYLGEESWVELVDETDPRSIAAGIDRVLSDAGTYEQRCRAARRAFEDRLNFERGFAPLLERMLALAAAAAV